MSGLMAGLRGIAIIIVIVAVIRRRPPGWPVICASILLAGNDVYRAIVHWGEVIAAVWAALAVLWTFNAVRSIQMRRLLRGRLL